MQLFRFDVIFSPGRLPLVTSASFIVARVEHKRTSAVSQVLGGQFLRKPPKTIGEKISHCACFDDYAMRTNSIC